MQKYFFVLAFCFFTTFCITSYAAPKGDFYQIKIYELNTDSQMQMLDNYLQKAYLPALHRAGISKVGVFKPIANDTAAVKKIYVFIPFRSADQFFNLTNVLSKDAAYKEAGSEYINAQYNKPPYQRIESILLEAFPNAQKFNLPDLKSPKSERVYELRSYEGPTEKLYENKVTMFNKGDEIGLFKRLGFNAVFYASVISGSHMPNLMYLTTFENMAEHDAHWKAFSDDAYWKKLSGMPEYQHNVSHADIILMHPAEYSDI